MRKTCVFFALLLNSIKTMNSSKYCKVIWDVTMLNVPWNKLTFQPQPVLCLPVFCRLTGLGILYYCQSKATEQKSMSTPSVFKHCQFQEKQAQLLHENLNYAFLCCFPLSIRHSASRNHEERSATVKIFPFSHQNIRKQDKNRQAYFKLFPLFSFATSLQC